MCVCVCVCVREREGGERGIVRLLLLCVYARARALVNAYEEREG